MLTGLHNVRGIERGRFLYERMWAVGLSRNN